MGGDFAIPDVRSGYLPVGDLRIYYETQGEGRGLVLLHGGLTTIDSSFPKLRPLLARGRKVVAIEQQAHGHTADLDRPLSYEQMVEDTAVALEQLGLSGADLFGWSDGGIVALGVAARRPDLVRRVAISGAGYSADAEGAEARAHYQRLDADGADLALFREAYLRVAPRPRDWPVLVDKCKAMWSGFRGWAEAEMRALAAPLLVMVGDRDTVRLEHAVELFRIVPEGRLAVLPGSDHGAPLTRSDWVAAMLADFFEGGDADAAPVQER
jgi:pimeloyl-ACP methyl ester carboxylesterase